MSIYPDAGAILKLGNFIIENYQFREIGAYGRLFQGEIFAIFTKGKCKTVPPDLGFCRVLAKNDGLKPSFLAKLVDFSLRLLGSAQNRIRFWADPWNRLSKALNLYIDFWAHNSSRAYRPGSTKSGSEKRLFYPFSKKGLFLAGPKNGPGQIGYLRGGGNARERANFAKSRFCNFCIFTKIAVFCDFENLLIFQTPILAPVVKLVTWGVDWESAYTTSPKIRPFFENRLFLVIFAFFLSF